MDCGSFGLMLTPSKEGCDGRISKYYLMLSTDIPDSSVAEVPVYILVNSLLLEKVYHRIAVRPLIEPKS